MSATSIRLTDELKARVAKAAKREGTSVHSFIVEAIMARADASERRADFYAEADRRWAEFLETGECIPWEEVRRYLKARIAGKDVKRPAARKLEN